MATSYASFNILANIAESLIPIERLVTGAAYLIGIALIMKGILTLKNHAESRGQGGSNSIKEPFVYFFVGGMLVYFPTGFEVLMNSTFGYSNVLAYAPQNSQSPLINALFGSNSTIGADLALFIQVVGVFAFVKGWLLITRSAGTGQPPGGTGKGMMHVFGGILAMNIVGTLQVINNTLYGAG
jgi:intracellular multiplication protein IcmC